MTETKYLATSGNCGIHAIVESEWDFIGLTYSVTLEYFAYVCASNYGVILGPRSSEQE